MNFPHFFIEIFYTTLPFIFFKRIVCRKAYWVGEFGKKKALFQGLRNKDNYLA
jgi:hypothetical protein